jgi:hypothetical protein
MVILSGSWMKLISELEVRSAMLGDVRLEYTCVSIVTVLFFPGGDRPTFYRI